MEPWRAVDAHNGGVQAQNDEDPARENSEISASVSIHFPESPSN